MHASLRGRPHRRRHWARRLIQIVWAVAVAQILLLVMNLGGLRQRLGPVLLALILLSLLVLSATARRLGHPPKPPPAAAADRDVLPVTTVFTATALGGPCDGACWQLGTNQLPVPQQVWLPAGGGSHCYRLASHQLSVDPTPQVTLTYTHTPRSGHSSTDQAPAR